MLLCALTSAVELRLMGRRDRMELLKKRSMTRAPTRRNTTSTRDSTEIYRQGATTGNGRFLLHDQLVAIFAHCVRNATVEQSVSLQAICISAALAKVRSFWRDKPLQSTGAGIIRQPQPLSEPGG
jgi:hypothetical protein